MSGILGTSTSGLLAFQRALQTVSHNIANVATPGYSRQRVELSNRAGAPDGSGFAGAGAQVDTVRRLVDEFNTGRLLVSGAEFGRLTELSRLTNRVDSTFTDPATSISRGWSELFDSMQAVSTDPASISAREGFLASAESVAARFRYLDSQLDSMEVEVNARISQAADEVSRLSAEIGRLNLEVVRQQAAAGGQTANDLLDQRDRLVDQLNSKIGVTTVLQDDGAINVFTLGGQAIVVGTRALSLGVEQGEFQPQRVEVVLELGGSTIRLPESALGGELAGLIEFRRDVLDATSQRLGNLAGTLASLFNTQNAEGIDLYGNSGAPIFVQPPIFSLPGVRNTGTGQLSSTVVDPQGLILGDIEMDFDGASWTATNASTGAVLPLSGTGTPGDPFLVAGVAIVVDAPPNAGDSFLVQSATGVAGRLQVAMTDPRQIAAAGPLQVSADLGNLGDARPTLGIVDRTDPNFAVPVDIEFIDAGTYTINGGGPIAWTPGDVIAVNGWELRLQPPPVAGDVFRIVPTPANSSDNTNARALAQLDDALRLNGGTGSLNISLRAMTTAVGADARDAEYALEAQSAIQQQLQLDRQSLSGVNLDEEASNMLKFQQAYQAAAQMIGTADTIFQSLLGAVRR